MKTEGRILAEVRKADLREALQTETDLKAIKRLVAALEYKSGTSPATIAEKYGWSTQTMYKWLYRFAERGGDAAIYDAAKPGRPPELSEAKKQQYREAVRAPPNEVELDAPAWTPALLGEYLEREFEVRYSDEHCRRLLHEAGQSIQTARPTHYKADRRKQTQWREEFKKVDTVPEGQIPNHRHRSAYAVGGNGSKAGVVSGGLTPKTGRLGRSPRSELCWVRSPRTATAFSLW